MKKPVQGNENFDTKKRLSLWLVIFSNLASNLVIASLLVFVLISALVSCSISEEMKRIEASRQYEETQLASRSTDLTGEQIFIRSCNTCHPGGREGLGPNLIDVSKKYPDDKALKAFIRKGAGIMPAQPENVISNDELNRLIVYVRNLK